MTVLTLEEARGNPRAVQVRIATAAASRVGAQRAHDLRLGPQPGYVDRDRSHLNRVLVAPETGAGLRAVCEDRRAGRVTSRAMKSNAAVGISGIVTFGHAAQETFEALPTDRQDLAYRNVAERVAERLGTSLTGLVVHADESAPHAHFQLAAYRTDGMPVSSMAKRAVLRDLQTIAAEIMGNHAPGIERGHSKLGRLRAGASPSEVVNLSVAELHDRLPGEIAAKEAEAQAARAKAEKNERLAATARAELEGLEAEIARRRETLDDLDRETREARTDLAAVERHCEVYEERLDGLSHAVAQKRRGSPPCRRG